ncbi:hypothetical protein NITHO_2960007 [Nitrolancea hollandica Lb]|uniref:Uncharacterized protein n=1 Tax=Nitrolancea hollandica Lb TaxID=1129897 RepID=I4EH23_9BACT|nr:hypothetical protein NITHO_2960007 [Nitrolancea hollandica Lb]
MSPYSILIRGGKSVVVNLFFFRRFLSYLAGQAILSVLIFICVPVR